MKKLNVFTILAILVVLLAGLVVFAACTKPDEYEDYLGTYELDAIHHITDTFTGDSISVFNEFEYFNIELKAEKKMTISYKLKGESTATTYDMTFKIEDSVLKLSGVPADFVITNKDNNKVTSTSNGKYRIVLNYLVNYDETKEDGDNYKVVCVLPN